MTDAEHAFWTGYVRRLADDLGLRDWDIRVAREEPAESTANGSMRVWFAQKRATMRLNRELIAGKGEQWHKDQCQVVIHELLHAHFDPIDDAVHLAFSADDDPKIALFREYHRRALEITLDGIASALAPHFPLPGEEK